MHIAATVMLPHHPHTERNTAPHLICSPQRALYLVVRHQPCQGEEGSGGGRGKQFGRERVALRRACGGEAAVACDVVARVTDQRGRLGTQMLEDLRASLEEQAAKLQETMNKQVESQMAEADTLEAQVAAAAVSPLSQLSPRTRASLGHHRM